MNAKDFVRDSWEYNEDRPIETMTLTERSPFNSQRMRNCLRYMVITGELRRVGAGVFRRNLNWDRQLPKRVGPITEVTHWPINKQLLQPQRFVCLGEQHWRAL